MSTNWLQCLVYISPTRSVLDPPFCITPDLADDFRETKTGNPFSLKSPSSLQVSVTHYWS